MSDSPQSTLAPSYREKRDFAQQLRSMTVACRVRHEKLGVRKALTKEQISQAAASFDAEGAALTAAKKLIDTKDPTYRAVVNVRSRAGSYWRACTTPYPEPGTRLIRKSHIDEFTKRMSGFCQELSAAATALQAKYEELRDNAAKRLGKLFNANDYPARIDTEFSLDWDFPSIEPPEYLKDLHPKLYEQECDRVKSRFEEAVRLTEQALATKFHEMVSHLAERLAGEADGKPKIFRDSAVENLNAFFEEFRALNMGSSEEMQAMVDRAQDAIKGIKPEDLRTNTDVKSKVAEQFSEITAAIDAMMVNQPKRAISLEDE